MCGWDELYELRATSKLIMLHNHESLKVFVIVNLQNKSIALKDCLVDLFTSIQ